MSEAWPRFWFEPWRWADAGWRSRYGPVPAPTGHAAMRLAYGGWIGAFGLERAWRTPPDGRWLQLVSFAPAALGELASVLGWIAVLRAPGGWRIAHGGETEFSRSLRALTHDRLLRCALLYRDVNCFEASIVESRRRMPHDARTTGLNVLRRTAELEWPDIAGRLAMMLAPHAEYGEERSAAAGVADRHSSPGDGDRHFVVGPLQIAGIEAHRCLTIALAAARRLGVR